MKPVHRFARAFGLIGFFVTVTAFTAQASDSKAGICRSEELKPFPIGHPFLLNDPRSGLMLYVESDGRHMAAITRDGKIAWQKNLFDDPRLERAFPPPPPQIDGMPPITDAQWKSQMHSYVGKLGIDRIGVVSDCMAHVIDHNFPSSLFRRHYIHAESGTHIEYLLDAKTGDFIIEGVN